ncbi:hypothetical protein A0U92_07275 [Acetobacter aceti]|uniref:Uncharacterized protein n=1 Tax=Acetobacter aceti TaxID=435 RepID=A0A1U9KFM6_ACEAC|nr:hypothetical protein [Acetobacter aceti]AQS84613.1 hypothetical protein A0U92_07275 [Acetobacter aceti]
MPFIATEFSPHMFSFCAIKQSMNDSLSDMPVIGNNKIANLTDAQLLIIELATDDPRREVTVSGKFPENCELTSILKTYDYREQKLPCSIRGCSARHHKGFVVQAGSEKGLVGKDCGKKHFGDSWDEHQNAYTDARNRQSSLLLRDKISSVLTNDAIKSIRAWRSYFQNVDSKIKSVRDFIPDIYKIILKNTEKGKYYLFTVEEIDKNILQYTDELRSRAPQFREKIIHRLPSSNIYCIIFRQKAEKGISLIDDYHNIIHKNPVSTSEMQRATKKLRDGIKILNEIFSLVPVVQNFLSVENLRGIARWAQLEGDVENISITDSKSISKIKIEWGEKEIQKIMIPFIVEKNHEVLNILSENADVHHT